MEGCAVYRELEIPSNVKVPVQLSTAELAVSLAFQYPNATTIWYINLNKMFPLGIVTLHRRKFKMRMLLHVTFPPEPFNSLVKEKRAGQILNKILGELKPEIAFFTEENGLRGGVLIIDISEPSQIPFFAEPFFLNFNAECRFRIAMRADDLVKADLDALGEKWK